MVGVAGWAVLVGLLLAWEGLAVTLRVPGWPSVSDMLRPIAHSAVGRWFLFAGWLWLGWHLFARGWTFLLSGPGPDRPRPPGARSAGQLLGQVVLPLAACFAAWLAMLAAAHRHLTSRPPATQLQGTQPTAGQRARRIAVTATCGYVVFVALMGAYAVGAGQVATGFFGAAVRQGALLTFAVAVPAFLLVTVVAAGWRSHRAGDRRR